MSERPTPLSLVLRGPAAERFEEIKVDAAGTAPLTRAAFAQLPAVQRLITTIEAPEPEVLAEYLAWLYVAFVFWSRNGVVLAVDPVALDAQLGRVPQSALAVPGGVCYLQFDERRFWLQIAPEQPHEPLDGIFVVGPEGPARTRDELTVLAVSGVRPERDGVSQVTLTAQPPEFLAAGELLRRPLYAPLMAGGDRMGFRSVASVAELLHLAHVALVVAGG